MTSDELVFLPLGGAGEIGMNLNLYGYGPSDDRDWIIVDCGITFTDGTQPGVDVILPDPSYIAERADRLLGIVLTHAHEDHLGAVAHLWPELRAPVYATPFSAAFLRTKLIESGIENEVPLHEVPLGGRVELGPFTLDYMSITHSIPEPNALAVRTPLGTVMHTGDWKLDPDPLLGKETDASAFAALGEEGVLAMVCDSTNVFTPGEAGSEAAVRHALMTLLSGLRGKVAVTAFASNVARVESIAIAGAAHGRHPVLVGRSMHRAVGCAKSVGYLNDMPAVLSDEEADDLPPDKVLYICTGSQGEARAALMRIAMGDHPYVTLGSDDTVIFSSRIIPGNERTIFELHNRLAEKGVEVITEKDHFVHVSGHPCRDELQQMYSWIRPKIAVPVHGEIRHLLEHAKLARDLQVPQTVVAPNGNMVRLAPGPAAIIDEVTSGRLYLDGSVLIPAEDDTVRDRKKMSFGGYLGITLVFEDDGALAADPRVVLRGLPFLDGEAERVEGEIADAVEAAVDRLPRRARAQDTPVEEIAARAARRIVRDRTGKRPVTDVQVIRLAPFADD